MTTSTQFNWVAPHPEGAEVESLRVGAYLAQVWVEDEDEGTWGAEVYGRVGQALNTRGFHSQAAARRWSERYLADLNDGTLSA